jgi:hypothetical protein
MNKWNTKCVSYENMHHDESNGIDGEVVGICCNHSALTQHDDTIVLLFYVLQFFFEIYKIKKATV